jgi:hypothetical protein
MTFTTSITNRRSVAFARPEVSVTARDGLPVADGLSEDAA